MKMEVQSKFDQYPIHIKPLLENLRELILEVAESLSLGDVEETLKWGEPSYLVKGGSTIRIDWKEKSPEQYFIFFNCNTKLIDTFRELYSEELEFQGNRAIILNARNSIPLHILRHCIELAMKYKSVKHKPLLGA
ncbi:DUF1801 domain-containing protein [Marinomonas sp. M1K-6]|uniref:DUF1801 domain-containing protein n=2 Tax=Marinomonas profundi TaxID=2726122 RepID=A0A847QY27_9GAMM|nr:DUF1801 domain-containing protein [Marinomonas profundi]UDV01814.1 DUF1801 domain-containing protein [Marinomonas profundi]